MDKLVFELNLQDVAQSLEGFSTQYFYNSKRKFASQKQEWPQAFLNIFFEDSDFASASFDLVKFKPFRRGLSLKMDVHTVGTYTGKLQCGTGMKVTIYLFFFSWFCFS